MGEQPDLDETLVALKVDRKSWKSAIVLCELSDEFMEYDIKGYPGTGSIQSQLENCPDFQATQWSAQERLGDHLLHFQCGDIGYKCKFFLRVESSKN